MKRLIIIVILFSIICSCEVKKDIVLYHPNGEVSLTYDTIKGQINGELTEFHDNGKVLNRSYYVNRKLHGYQYIYHDNGNLSFKGEYVDDKLQGKVYSYYRDGTVFGIEHYCDDLILGVQYYWIDSLNSNNVKKRLYIPFEGKSCLVGEKYESNGAVIYDSSRVITEVLTRNIHLGDSVEIYFIKSNPNFNNFRVHILNLDDCFRLVDSTDNILAEGNGNSCKSKIKATRKGINKLRGKMEDYKVTKMNKDGSHTTLGTVNNFFEVEFMVK